MRVITRQLQSRVVIERYILQNKTFFSAPSTQSRLHFRDTLEYFLIYLSTAIGFTPGGSGTVPTINT